MFDYSERVLATASLSFSIGGIMFGTYIFMDLQILIGEYWMKGIVEKHLKKIDSKIGNDKINNLIDLIASVKEKLEIFILSKNLFMDCSVYIFALIVLYSYIF